jgi:exonuclease SbcD
MRILHTADWHLNDRLGRIRRQSDIVARLEEIARYLDEYQVDVMLVAGDMFSQYTRLDELQVVMGDIDRAFKPFLLRGGTIVAISGNHDNEALFNLLRFALDLADPLDPNRPGPRPGGRLYLATQPTYLLLKGAEGQQVQFALMPYPTSARYLRDARTRYSSLDEKNRLLHQALTRKLRQFNEQMVDPRLPSVLVAHIHVRGSKIHNLYHISEREDVIFEPGDIPTHWAYVAYGHIHKPQILPGTTHVRYAGSIERLDYAEREDNKGVVLVEIGPTGRTCEPECLPLDATPIYYVEILDPKTEMAGLGDRYLNADRALVSYRLVYKPGEDNRDELCCELESIFPRWYRREIVPEGFASIRESTNPTTPARDVPGTVRDYLQQRLVDHPDRDDVLALADQLLTGLEVNR